MADFISQAIDSTMRGLKWGFDISKAGTIGSAAVLGTGAAIGGSIYGMARGAGYTNYKMSGNLMSIGFDVSHQNTSGGNVFKGWGHEVTIGKTAPGEAWFKQNASSAAGFAEHGWSYKGLKGFAPHNLPGMGLNAFFMYQGYKEGGLGGAWDAFSLNTAVEASLFRWSAGVGNAYDSSKGWMTGGMKGNVKLAGHPLRMSMGNTLVRGLGAGIGGYVGQQLGLSTGVPMGGVIGATAGAYIGGAPIQALRANPLLVGGVMLGASAALVGYGAYSTIKAAGQAGYDYRQGRRGINTDGDMGAFMTQNAMTMRERSVQAIAKSHLNARSALGQEANFMHSPRNYNSSYR